MKNLHQLMEEIIQISSEMESKYPELYKYLNETPLFLGESQGKEINTKDLENYLNTLKEQLKDYIQTHKTKLV
jgi:hypothetical protein